MDIKLEELLYIQELQSRILDLRTNPKIPNMLKRTTKEELSNLVSIEMDIPHNEIKIPDAKKLPPLSEISMHTIENLNELTFDYASTLKALQFVK